MRNRVVRIPCVLAVAAIGAALGCPEKPEDGESATSSADSGAAELPACPADAVEAACIAANGCAWDADVGCVVDCAQLDDQLTCETPGYCYWVPAEGGCVWGIA